MAQYGLQIFFFTLLFGQILTQYINVEEASKAKKDGAGRSEHKARRSHMDLLIDNMMHQRWESEDSKCLEKILNVMNNVKNSTLWATWIWDAMQSPVGLLYGSKNQFGNYDQCMNAPWLHTHPEYRTQYCLADIKLADEELEHTYIHPDNHVKNYIKTSSKYGVTFHKLLLGVCLPVECKTRAVSQFVKVLIEDSHLGDAVPDVNITVSPCQVAGAPVEYSKEFYIVTYLILSITTINILINIYIYGRQNIIENKYVKAFCIKTNTLNLCKSTEDDIKVMHGMRYLTTCIGVYLHVYILTHFIGTGNVLLMDKKMEEDNVIYMYHSDLIIDTYLMMSGLLLIKGLMASKHLNPIVSIAKRYLKFVYIQGLFISVMIYVLIPLGDGPLWPIATNKEANACEKNWWPNFLMLGNYIDTANMCYPTLWTMPADFHLYIIGIIIYWIFIKNRRAGILTFSSLFVASIIMPGYVTYQRKLPGTPNFDLKVQANIRELLFTNPTYIWTHLRAGPYFVGMIIGYIMSLYKPANNRKIISKLVSTVGFVIAFTIALSMIKMGGSFHDNSKPYNVWEAAIFASVNRTVWAVAMASIIMLCEYGTVPLIGSFLSWQSWVLLSKLSYGVYLVHIAVFSQLIFSIRFPLTSSNYLIVVQIMGVILISNILSYLLNILYETPMIKILNVLLHHDFRVKEVEKHERNEVGKNRNDKKYS